MTRVEITRTPENAIACLQVKGHSGRSAGEMESLVCAAISAVMQTTILGLQAHAPGAVIEQDERAALIRITLPDELLADGIAQALLDTACRGLTDILDGRAEYGTIIHKERRWKA